MDIHWALIELCCGVVLLWKGADLLVAGAVDVAKRFGISPLIIGLTIVAMGTSAPEVAASIAAVLGEGGGDVAVGNICGSNVANLALVGGIIALIHAAHIGMRMMSREFPLMIVSTLVLWPVLADNFVSRLDASLLLSLFIALLLFTIGVAKRERIALALAENPDLSVSEPFRTASSSITGALLRMALGLTGLAFGADFVVDGARTLGQALGLSDGFVGIVFVAIGTSLPELVTCVVAAAKGHHDISIGNLVGSNVFNVLLVTACAGLASPFCVSSRFAGGFDYLAMLGVSVLFWIICLLGKGAVGRPGGALLLATYIGYLVYTISVET